MTAIVVPPLTNARDDKAHGNEECARRAFESKSRRRHVQLERDGERELIPARAVAGSGVPRAYLGHRRPVIAREARRDALLEGEIPHTHSTAE